VYEQEAKMENIYRTTKDFTAEERSRLLDQYSRSGLGHQEFAKEHNINPNTMRNWVWMRGRGFRAYSPTEKKKILEAYLSSGMTQTEFSKGWGLCAKTLGEWEKRYEQFGAEGLMRSVRSNDKRFGSKIPLAVQSEIVAIKKKEPSYGIKRISHWLFRFRGMKVSANSVRKTVVREGFALAQKKKKRKKSSDRIRRFERARPMQLWQSDITQLTLGQYWARVYLTVFMDDHSRYIVGWRLQSRQTADLVIDAFKDATTRFGKPEEVLTDQGRQYFAWRGKSELEKLLEKEGIKHVVSRAHHPQTLGKCERFWETVQNEFWTRAKPHDLDEARVRLKHFIDHYNHQRPHQGIDGRVPADRFFGIAEEVRCAIEKTVEQNALAMAIGELPKPPAFLIGQVGDQRIAFHGTSGQFYLQQENISERPPQDFLKNGDSNGRADDVGSKSNRTTTSEEAANEDCSRAVSGGSDPWVMGEGDHRGKRASDDACTSDDRVLDGAFKQVRGARETELKTDSFLAVEEPGGFGDDGGLINPTANEGGFSGQN
jgi:transposase InsO family protein/transposase-like protein